MSKIQKTCPCGYDVEHAWVIDHACYSAIGWVLILIGISSLPRAIERRCGRCGFVFSRTTDVSVCEAKRYH